MPSKPHAAGVLIVADGHALFLKRSTDAADYPGHWCLPGGGIDNDEGPKRAARREVLEETGITVTQPLNNPIDTRDGFVTYRATFGGEQPVTLNFEHSAYIWAKLSEAPSPLHPGVRATLDKIDPKRPRTQIAGVHITAAGRRNMASDARGTLAPIRPSAPTRIAYQKRVDALIDEMANSLLYWLKAAYRADEPAAIDLGADALPLQNAFDKLARRWLRRFDTLSEQLSEWFATSVENRVDRTMKADMRKAGFTVKFQQSPAMREAVDAVIAENVALIRSIGAQHLEGVQVALSQSIATGRDLASLTEHLTKRVGVTKRRAALIARDQTNKATATMVRTRALENGITRARWQHSAGGKTPRPEHVKASRDRLVFDMTDGVNFENGEGTVWPGTAINCRCVAIPIIPGFD